MQSHWQDNVQFKALAVPGLGAPAALTFGEDVGHPFTGERNVALSDPLPELS